MEASKQTGMDCGGVMHNFSYLGGVVGVITGLAFLILGAIADGLSRKMSSGGKGTGRLAPFR